MLSDVSLPRPRLIAAATAAAVLSLSASAQPFLSPTLFLGNGPESCIPQDPALAAHPGGGFQAVWHDGRVVWQRFDRHAAAIERGGGLATGFSEAPAVAVSPGGVAAVAWFDRQSGVVEGMVLGDGPQGFQRLELGAVDLGGSGEHELPAFRIGLAGGPGGEFFAVWQGGPPNAALFDAENGVRLRFSVEPGGGGCGDLIFQPAAAYDPVGDRFVAAWVALGISCITSPPFLAVHARSFGTTGAPLGPPVPVGTSWILPFTPGPAVLPAPDGGFTVVWNGAAGHNDVAVMARRFGPGGAPAGEKRVIADVAAVADVAAAADAAGNLAVLWADRAAAEAPIELRARTFDPALVPTSSPFLLDADPPEDGAPLDPAVALSGPGEVTALWWKQGAVFGGVPLDCTGSEGLRGRRLGLGGDEDLLLRDGRFRVSVAWEDPHNGGSGVGRPLPDSDRSGSFWFFQEGNRELVVKVLDGRAINGRWWVFYGSLTDVAFTLTVTDQATGESRTYENPPFTFASRGDTAAFAGLP